jgi:large subunit ribosomal protein L15
MPLVRRIPKRGFTHIFREPVTIINLKALQGLPAGTEVTPELLVDKHLVRRSKSQCIKLLGHGDVPAGLVIKLHLISDGAKQKVEAAGGKVQLLGE